MAAEEKTNRDGQGTFAQLYDVQEELSRRHAKPLGRPRKKVQRKPTTIHLTQAENRGLSRLHLVINEKFSINRSELVGVAIDALVTILDDHQMEMLDKAQIEDVESFRRFVCSFVKS